MTSSKSVVTVLVVGAIALFAGCSGSIAANADAGTGGNADSGVATVQSGSGICLPSCDRSCNVDNDCDVNDGELCCDYGSGGKVCQAATACPMFCTSDTTCDTSTGQACVERSLVPGAQEVCALAADGLELCRADADCSGTTSKCCTVYKSPICTPANQCPTACAMDSECDTASGAICCTTAGDLDPNLGASGLCLNPLSQPCPKACTTSSDCSGTGSTLLCCNGYCQATCAKTCDQSSDCPQEICCKAPSTLLPPGPMLFAAQQVGAPDAGGHDGAPESPSDASSSDASESDSVSSGSGGCLSWALGGIGVPAGTVATASASYGNQLPAQAIDGALTTDWNSGANSGALTLTFPGPQEMTGIRIAAAASPSTSEVYTVTSSGVSLASATESVTSGGPPTAPPTIEPSITFGPGSYSSLTITIDGESSWVEVAEVSILTSQCP
jgi:hypothetical protein